SDTVVTGHLPGSNGLEDVYSGGTAIGTTVENDAFQLVEAGGAAIAAIVISGGSQQVRGTVIGTTVSSGGTEIVLSGGVFVGGNVRPGGSVTVSSGGVLLDAGAVLLSGGAIISGPTQTLSGAVIGSGESVYVLSSTV